MEKRIIEIQKRIASLKHFVNERLNEIQKDLEEIKDEN
jgi:hypothetical protein